MAADQVGYTLSEVTEITSGEISLGGPLRAVVVDVTPTASSYFPTGYLITAAKLGLRKIYGAMVLGTNPAGAAVAAAYMPLWDAAHTALQFFGLAASSGLTEAASAADVSGTVARVMFIGN